MDRNTADAASLWVSQYNEGSVTIMVRLRSGLRSLLVRLRSGLGNLRWGLNCDGHVTGFGYSLGSVTLWVRSWSEGLEGSVTIKFRSLTIISQSLRPSLSYDSVGTCAIIDCIFAVWVTARPPLPSKRDQSTLIGPARVNRVYSRGDKSTWGQFDKNQANSSSGKEQLGAAGAGATVAEWLHWCRVADRK